MPWRAVHKESSVSTPVRLVVDPTCTGLNEILAKGTNMLPLIPEILIQFRSHRYAWNLDVSKMYNQLHLKPASLPYSLFLFHPDLSTETPPEIWVMTRAWYGVASTGNQAGWAIEELAITQAEAFPAAFQPLTKERYIDDVLGGVETEVERENQIQQVSECLRTGGFGLKYVAKSGEPPPEEATADNETMSCLGHSWDPVNDTLSLEVDPMVIKKKVKGIKGIPAIDIKSEKELRQALTNAQISKTSILSRIAEMYDPVGLWEPLKVQCKLAFQHLSGLEWTDPVLVSEAETWLKLIPLISAAPVCLIPRLAFPIQAPPNAPVRLLCLADAGTNCGGTAVYGGVKLGDGTWSCPLLYSKSKLMSNTVPRNELASIVLMADAALLVQKALGSRVKEVFYFSDSAIAICWILNTSRRLRMWVHNRVTQARAAMFWTTNQREILPLYHIAGPTNVADLLTKPHPIRLEDISEDSEWQQGQPWMRLPSAELPKAQIFTPTNPEEAEKFSKESYIEIGHVDLDSSPLLAAPSLEITSTSVENCPSGGPETDEIECHGLRVDQLSAVWLTEKLSFVRLGWNRALGVLGLVHEAAIRMKHGRAHQKNTNASCPVCQGTVLQESSKRALHTVNLLPPKSWNGPWEKTKCSRTSTSKTISGTQVLDSRKRAKLTVVVWIYHHSLMLGQSRKSLR
jgi:hypothetical protein